MISLVLLIKLVPILQEIQYMTKESYSCLPQRQGNQLFYPCHLISCLEHWVNTARLHSVETSSTTTTLGDGCFCRTISEASLL